MKELFETPEVKVVVFTLEDVIAASGGIDIDTGENEGPFVPKV